MAKLATIFGTIALSIACAASSRAQVLPEVQQKFADYQHKNLQEKLFIHTDKNFYLAGEIIWFKVYCVEASTNKPLDLSKVAYLELIDNAGNAAVQTKVSLDKGSGAGSVLLPFSLNNGNYLLRAYTSWMKNFSPDYFFQSELTIVNPLKAPDAQPRQKEQFYDVQFFPEGGRLVQGLTSRVAFKVTGADGKGVSCTGVVLGQQNDTVARFSTLRFGMGSFMLRPISNSVYKAVIKIGSNVINKTLPGIGDSGYVLRATENSGNWNVLVRNADSSSSARVYLVVHNDHRIGAAFEVKTSNGSASFEISRDKLAEGMNYFTLFDEQQRPLCERIVFKRPAQKLLVDVKTDGQTYGGRAKVDLAITTHTPGNQSTAADLSVAVFHADGLQNQDVAHISGYLWLKAGLKGDIESPDYYLDNTDTDANQALDNLMLSQGWTQFDWDRVLSGKGPVLQFLPEYTGPIVTGHIINTVNNTPATGMKAYLTIPGSPDQLYIAGSNANGDIFFNTQKFYGLKEIFVQTNAQQDSTYRIDIASPFSERKSSNRLGPFAVTAEMRNALARNNVDMQVQNIFAVKQLKQFYDPLVDTTAFFGKPDKVYKLDDFTRFPTMEEVLREYVTSIAVTKRQGKFNIKIFKVDHLIGNPLVLLDGVPVFDVDKIFKVDPLKIRKLEVFNNNYLYGLGYFNGIMSFSTYKDDRAAFEIDPHAVILDYEGLQLQRKFYSPVYDTNDRVNSTIPDFRSTLYWNPGVTTGSDGKATLNFYTGDHTGEYIGVIEGITGDGAMGSGYFRIEVKK
ncbi:MAG: hypothetical protein JST19_13945 [Bacteroidetes bacterium]|nr:hypothetical protein [Bacteroidota bacterium]